MKIVVLDGYAANPGDISWEPVERLGELTVYDRTKYDDAEIIERISDADLALTNKVPINAKVIAACPKLKYIGVLATGYNIVDIKAAAERGIPVCNIPSYCTQAVAQLTFALLLEICHNVGHHSREVHSGRWTASADFCFWDYRLIELAGKTFGIVGYGSIGRATARLASALGMRVLAYNRHEKEPEDGVEFVSLEQLLANSDVVSLHCPLNADSQGLINCDRIALMKDGAILINTSRGGLLDESAVADALNSGKLYAAGIDVASVEPIRADNPLLGAKNCVITPHIAWAPYECRERLMELTARNIEAYINGSVINCVNL